MNTNTSAIRNPKPVLLVEDSPGDARLTEEAFREVNAGVKLYRVEDGVEALAFLRREGQYADAPRPDLILLDLNLPRMDGRQVLAQVKADAKLKSIPTIILTVSLAHTDFEKCYELNANCFLSKPQELQDFETLVRTIDEFWVRTVKLPVQ